MPTIVQKSDLTIPYVVNTANVASGLFNSIYPIADAGSVGAQPATIPDLVGTHTINMTYGTNGGIVAGGNLELANNGQGSLNTYGTVSGIDATWAEDNKFSQSRIYLIDFVYNVESYFQSIINLAGLQLLIGSDGLFDIVIQNISSHEMRYLNIDAGLNEGDRVVVAVQIDQTNDVAYLIINGVSYTGVQNGNPFATTKPKYTPYIGREPSWNNYYGYNGHIDLLAFGYDFNGSELTEQQLIDLTLNPYDILESDAGVPTRISKDFNVNFDLLSRQSKPFTFLTNLLMGIRVSKDFNVTLNLTQRVSKDFTIIADLLTKVGKDYVILTDLLARVSKDFSFNLDLLERITRQFIIQTSLMSGARVSKDFNMTMNLHERVSKDFEVTFNALVRLGKSFTLVTDLLNRISKDFEVRFGLSERTSKDFNITMNLHERVSKGFNLIIRVDSDVTKTPAHYVVNITDTVDFSEDTVTIHFNDGSNNIII